jgi:uncharacterized protein (DUF302 family)
VNDTVDSVEVEGSAAYTIATRSTAAFDEVRARVEAALHAEGFGVLTVIDVAATMKAKLGVDGEPYVILGACNPPLAHRAIEAEPSVGALLPCNVVIRRHGGRTVVEAMDPEAVLGFVRSSAVGQVAREAREHLVRVISSLESN